MACERRQTHRIHYNPIPKDYSGWVSPRLELSECSASLGPEDSVYETWSQGNEGNVLADRGVKPGQQWWRWYDEKKRWFLCWTWWNAWFNRFKYGWLKFGRNQLSIGSCSTWLIHTDTMFWFLRKIMFSADTHGLSPKDVNTRSFGVR